MGTNPYLWFVPIWGTGPAGDGVHWERKPESGELRTLGDVEGGRGPPPDQSDNAVCWTTRAATARRGATGAYI